VFDVNNAAIDTVPDEVSVNINVFHVQMVVWVMGTSDRALIITEKDSGI
jgi:hypothetical protein